MIQKCKSYQTSDGQTFVGLGAAQKHEIEILLGTATDIASEIADREKIAQWLLDNGPKLVDILTTKGSSKPAARAVNGGTKKRTPKNQPAQTLKPDAA